MSWLSLELLVLVVVFFAGAVVGAAGLWYGMSLWSRTAEGKRLMAAWRAEQRIRDVQHQALRRLAADAEEAVRFSTALGFTDHDIDVITRDERARDDDGDVIEGTVVGEWVEG